MSVTTVTLRGDGGVEWEFELPLSDVFADQVRTRKLVPVDDDSHEALADLLYEEAADGGSETTPVTEPLTLAERIDAVSNHAEANALAEELNVEGFEAKKPPLDAKRAALHDAAADGGSETT